MSWWRDAVVYQVYPRTFHDSDGDGIGDLQGVIARLDYLRDLGVDAIWLSPFYPSPQRDGGYDIADPRAVDPDLGSLADFDRLVENARARNIRVIVDVVPNHVSSDHPWFKAALAAPRNSPERARFHFRDGIAGGPPNNWVSVFGGPAWTQVKDPQGIPEQWYLHLFDSGQPDLNWTHPDVIEDFETTLRFWLDRGVAGFRVDVALAMAKDMTYLSRADPQGLVDALRLDLYDHTDVSASDRIRARMVESPFFDRDEVHDIFARWRKVMADYPDSFAVAEAWAYPSERAMRYAKSLGQVFNFDFMVLPFDADVLNRVASVLMRDVAAVGSSPTWVLSNHDSARVATRLGGGTEGVAKARALAMATALLPGSMYVYQGDELGLEDAFVAPDLRRDPIWQRSGHSNAGRDGSRVPMPWDSRQPNNGFSSCDPSRLWLPIDPTWRPTSAASQAADPSSTLGLYRTLLRLRREHPAWRQTDVTTSARHGQWEIRRGTLQLVVNTTAESAPVLHFGQVLARSRLDVPWERGVLPPHAAVLLETSQSDLQVEVDSSGFGVSHGGSLTD